MSNYYGSMVLNSEIMKDGMVRTYVNCDQWLRIEHKKRKSIDIVYTIHPYEGEMTELDGVVIEEYAKRVSYAKLNQKVSITGNKRLTEIQSTHKMREQLVYVVPNRFKKSGKGMFIRIIKDASVNDSEYEEIVGEAVLAFTFLARYVAKSYSELWQLRYFVYKWLDNYFDSRKTAAIIQEKEENRLKEQLENSLVCDDGIFCGELMDIDNYILKVELGKHLLEYFSQKKRCPAELIVKTYIDIVINEYTKSETAKHLGISCRMVSHYVGMFRNNLKNIPEIRDIIRKYHQEA